MLSLLLLSKLTFVAFIRNLLQTIKPMLCGISLPHAAVSFARQVEEEAKAPIDCIIVDQRRLPGDGTAVANSLILDGVPTIHMSNPTLIRVVHELFHLEMEANGSFPPGTPTAVPEGNCRIVDGKYLSDLRINLYSALQHRLFFPKMMKIGINPNQEYNIGLDFSINQKRLEPSYVQNPEEAVLTYLRIVETDQDHLQAYKNLLRQYGLQKDITLGKKIEHIVLQTNPQTKSEAEETLRQELSVLFCTSAT